MPNATESQIKAHIAEFVEELNKIVRLSMLEALEAALSNRTAPAPRGRPAGVRRGPGHPRGSGNVDDAAAKIVAYVRASDGQGIGAIAAATRVALPLAKKAAIQLLASGALKKSGVRRGTVYHSGGGRKAGKRRAPKAKRAVRKAKKATKKAPVARPARRRRSSPRDGRRPRRPPPRRPNGRPTFPRPSPSGSGTGAEFLLPPP